MPRTLTRNILSSILLVTVLVSSFRIHSLGIERRELRADAMELGSITYGLFDPSEWKTIIGQILEKKVNEFEITDENRTQIRGRLMDVMNGLLTEAEQVMEKRNKDKGFKGMMRNVLMDVLVDVDDIRSGIPRYADMMIEYVNDPRNKQEMQCFVVEQLDALESRTEGLVDRSVLHEVLARHGATDRKVLAEELRSRMHELEVAERNFLLITGVAALGLFLLSVWAPPKERGPLIATILAAIGLLVTGLLLPMIDIEASIAEFSLTLIGEPVAFHDQVLFHQSKSILDVVHILLSDGGVALSVVGVLVFTFSVLIPTSKMLLSLVALSQRRAPKNKLMRFLIFHAGKWSMADVMVVAIFMAFIGFNGVVDNQLAELEGYVSSVHVLTTNNSSLEVGFYLFTAYCLLGLGCAVLLGRSVAQAEPSAR